MTAQRSWCADRDDLKLKWLASELQHALFSVYWLQWACVQISDTRNSLPTKDCQSFLVSEICTVTNRGIFSILRWGFQDCADRGEEVIVPSHIVPSHHHLTHHPSTWPPNISTSPLYLQWRVKVRQLGAWAMVERLGDRWGLNTASLSRRGSAMKISAVWARGVDERVEWDLEEVVWYDGSVRMLFLARWRNSQGKFKTTKPRKLPISKKSSAKRCDNWNCAEIWSKKNAANFQIRPLDCKN